MKTKIYNKILLPIILTFIMVMCCFLSGCGIQSAIFTSLKNGFSINRIIYTNNAQKYIEGKELIRDDSTPTDDMGIYAFNSTEPNMVDVVIDTTVNYVPTGDGSNLDTALKNTQGPKMGLYYENALYLCNFYSLDTNVKSSNEKSYSLFLPNTSRYLFANDFKGYQINYTTNKIDPENNCTCGTKSGSDFGTTYNCGCWNVNTDGSVLQPMCPTGKYGRNDVIPGYSTLDAIPRCCYSVTEIFNDDGTSTNTFNVTHICNCNIVPTITNTTKAYSTYVDMFDSEFGYSTGSDTLNHFKELVIDGFDLNNYVYHFSNILSKWQSCEGYDTIANTLNFNDYGYMFYGLGCEKISLNNITFPTEYPVQSLSHMFDSCLNLREVDFGNFFDNLQPTDLSYMFYNCPKLNNIDLSMIDTSKTTNMSNMFTTFSSRDESLLDIINTSTIPEEFPELNDGTVYTWDTLLEKFPGYAMEDILINGIKFGVEFPMTYDEFCLRKWNATYETVLANPGSYEGLAEVSDGTTEEIDDKILGIALGDGVSRLYKSKQEIDNLYSVNAGGGLRLGGTGSKFVINDSTDVTNMFGNITKFNSISAPTIAEGVEIQLPNNYNDGTSTYTKLTSSNSRNTINLGEAPEPIAPLPPDPNAPVATPTKPTKNNAVLWWVIGGIMGLVVIATIVVFSSFSVHKRKNKEK